MGDSQKHCVYGWLLATTVITLFGYLVGQNVPEGIIITTPKQTTSTSATTITSKSTSTTVTTVLSTTGTTTTSQPTSTKMPRTTKNKKSKEIKSPVKLTGSRFTTNTPKIKATIVNNKDKNKKGQSNSKNEGKTKKPRPKNKVDKVNRKKEKKQKKKQKKEVRKEKKKAKKLFRQTKSKLKRLKKSARRKIKLGEKSYMKDFIRNCSILLKSIKREWKERKTNKVSVHSLDEDPANSYEVVQTLNNFGKDIALSLNIERAKRKRRKEVIPISSEQIDMEVSVVSTDQFTGYAFPDPTSKLNITDSIKLPSEIFTNSAAENGTIISIVYDAIYEMHTANATNKFENGTLNSKVLSTTVYPHPSGKLKQPVEIVLTHLKKPNSTTPECVFWQVNQSNPSEGYWSSNGCIVFASNSTHTVCHCNHLTDFAVLFRVSKVKKIPKEHKLALTLISLVGCLLSSICLMITVLVFLILRKLLRSTRNMLHFNLAAALLMANILFLLADKAISIKNLCLGISLALFYFFLVAFCLMLGEGIYIWIMVAKAFSQNLKKWMYAAIGWGIPLIIVGVSFGILRYNMVSSEFCWLSVYSGAIWAFIGPVVFVITVNLCILVKVLCTAVEHQSDGSNLKVSARLTLLLMPILGLTWLFGVFAMNEKTIVFEYLFTIFNSFQGLFIFICYILLNGEVRTEYQKFKARKEYSQSLAAKSSSSTKETRDRRSRTGTQNEEVIQMMP